MGWNKCSTSFLISINSNGTGSGPPMGGSATWIAFPLGFGPLFASIALTDRVSGQLRPSSATYAGELRPSSATYAGELRPKTAHRGPSTSHPTIKRKYRRKNTETKHAVRQL